MEVYCQLRHLSKAISLFEEKMKFQQKLQEQYGDSRLVVVHEYIPDIDPIRVKFQIKNKHVASQNQITPMVPSYDDIQEQCKEGNEEFVHDLEEVVATSCMEKVGSTIECLEVVDSHPRLE